MIIAVVARRARAAEGSRRSVDALRIEALAALAAMGEWAGVGRVGEQVDVQIALGGCLYYVGVLPRAVHHVKALFDTQLARQCAVEAIGRAEDVIALAAAPLQ